MGDRVSAEPGEKAVPPLFRVLTPEPVSHPPSPFPQLPIDQSPCNGCTECRHRCTAGIALTRPEYEAIRDYLAVMDPGARDVVLNQDKERPWPGAETEATYTACRFFDIPTGFCLVYPVRPLICRLFGHVEWLPCPIEKIETHWKDAPALMRARAGEEQHTWEEWTASEAGGSCGDGAPGIRQNPSSLTR